MSISSGQLALHIDVDFTFSGVYPHFGIAHKTDTY